MTDTKIGWIWHEIMTTDVSKASEYYRSLFGWTGQEMKMGDTDYLMFNKGEQPVAGMLKAMEGAPSHWLGYVLVDDAAASEAKIEELGGKIMMSTFEIPNMGKSCIATDTEGAAFALFQANEPEPARQGPPPEGTVCWTELMATDDAKMSDFYTKLFGWTAEPMGPGMTVLKQGDTMVASIRKKEGPAAQVPSHWLVYLAVSDVDEAVKKNEELGGTTHMTKMEVPNMGEFAVIADPTGSTYAFWHQTGEPPQ